MIDKVQLAEIVGKNNVSDENDVLKKYSQDISFVPSIRSSYAEISLGHFGPIRGAEF